MWNNAHLLFLFCILISAGCVSDQIMDSTTTSQASSTTSVLSTPSTSTSTTSTSLHALATTTSATEPSQTSSTSTVPAGTFIAGVSDVPVGSAHYFKYGGDDAVLVNLGGEYKAFTRECTHAGCALSLDGGVLKCPCHGSHFDPSTGAVLKGPAKEPLASIDVLVEGDKIYVR